MNKKQYSSSSPSIIFILLNNMAYTQYPNMFKRTDECTVMYELSSDTEKKI